MSPRVKTGSVPKEKNALEIHKRGERENMMGKEQKEARYTQRSSSWTAPWWGSRKHRLHPQGQPGDPGEVTNSPSTGPQFSQTSNPVAGGAEAVPPGGEEGWVSRPEELPESVSGS